MSIGLGDVNHSFEMFDQKMTEVLDKHVPLRKLNKKQLRLQSKPWITPGILNSIKRRDMLLRKYINTIEINLKNEIHIEYKALRNKIVALIRNSKKNHFRKFFSENANDVRKTWTGIKSIINIRTLTKGQPNSLSIDNKLITNPSEIAEGFNNYFSTIAEKLQQDTVFGTNNFSKYLDAPLNYNFLFNPADSNEILFIIDSMENRKATGPHSIPTEI